jgi:hypothetical protein
LAFDYVFVFELCTIVASTIARGFAPFFYIFISSSYPVFPNKAGISIFLYGNAEHPAPFKLLSQKKASSNSGPQSTTARDENTIQHVMLTRIKPFCALFAFGIWK